ncbi:hypothetical protein J6590_008328 [Homalodisca vitripennis]|nr:hypothetical protein J6590_008328 [Homalodisca vitripennis]
MTPYRSARTIPLLQSSHLEEPYIIRMLNRLKDLDFIGKECDPWGTPETALKGSETDKANLTDNWRSDK